MKKDGINQLPEPPFFYHKDIIGSWILDFVFYKYLYIYNIYIYNVYIYITYYFEIRNRRFLQDFSIWSTWFPNFTEALRRGLAECRPESHRRLALGAAKVGGDATARHRKHKAISGWA